MTRLRARDDSAAREIVQRFARQLIAPARRRFRGTLKHKVDPEDIVQSAYKSLFRGYPEGKLDVRNRDSLWGLLSLLTLRKCADRVGYHRAQCRDSAREAALLGPEKGAPCPEPLGREPTPLEAALLRETVERLLDGLDADERPVVELSLQGYTTREIIERLGRAERTVRLLPGCGRKRLEHMQRRMQREGA
jgi:RNA polymerase sigma-70 factor (ECF subfamily)